MIDEILHRVMLARARCQGVRAVPCVRMRVRTRMRVRVRGPARGRAHSAQCALSRCRVRAWSSGRARCPPAR
eukprot:319807-Pleurochrysis_carterae.AAC.1